MVCCLSVYRKQSPTLAYHGTHTWGWLLVSHILCKSILLSVSEFSDLLLTNGIWHRWQDVICQGEGMLQMQLGSQRSWFWVNQKVFPRWACPHQVKALKEVLGPSQRERVSCWPWRSKLPCWERACEGPCHKHPRVMPGRQSSPQLTASKKTPIATNNGILPSTSINSVDSFPECQDSGPSWHRNRCLWDPKQGTQLSPHGILTYRTMR